MVFISYKTVKKKRYYSLFKYENKQPKLIMYIGDKNKLREFHEKIGKYLENSENFSTKKS